MLSMSKRFQIQTLANAGHTHEAIAQLSGASPSTVARILKEDPVTCLLEPPARKDRRLGRPSLVEPFRKLVQQCLQEQPDILSAEILRRAKLDGYKGGKSALYDLVKQLRLPEPHFTVRFEAVPGEFSQHDFGQVQVTYNNGHTETLTFLATRMKFSRWVQVSIVPDQSAETLVRAVCDHFDLIGGVPLFAVFDRPRTVALQWKADGTITRYNPIFQQALFDMGVCPEVCWPYSPQQKGAVENLVGWVKGSFFKVRRFQDRHDLLAQLDHWHQHVNFERNSRATGVPPQARIAAERARLRPLKVGPDELAIRRPFKVGPSATVSLDGNSYSMDPAAVGACGTALVFKDSIVFETPGHSARHPRLTLAGGKSTLPSHRSARLAVVSGKRGKLYQKRQDIMDIGPVAEIFVGELVHRQPHNWAQDIELLFDLLQTHGQDMLRLGLHMCTASRAFTGQRVKMAIEQPELLIEGVSRC